MNSRRFWMILSTVTVLCMLVTACATPAPTVAPTTAPPLPTAAPQPTTAATAVAPPTAAPPVRVGGKFIGATVGEPQLLDTHRASGTADAWVNPLMHEGLVVVAPPGDRWVPQLAESWETSEDGLTWIFNLRKGVKFHNGREFTADDVVWNFERIMNPDVGAMMGATYRAKIESVEAVGTYQVKFVLKAGGRTFLADLGLATRSMIIAKECVEADGSVLKPIATGPFKLAEYKEGEYIRFERFADYWGQVADIDEVELRILADVTVRETALQTGEVDYAGTLSTNTIVEWSKNPPKGVILKVNPNFETVRLIFNMYRPPCDNPLVRQAIGYAVDRELINEAVFYGLATTHSQPWQPDSPLHLDFVDPYGKGDIAKAKDLLAQAGYPNGVEVEVVTTGTSVFRPVAEVLQASLKPAGINIKVTIMDAAGYGAARDGLEWDMLTMDMGLPTTWERFFGYFEPGNASQKWVGKFTNDAVTSIIQQARSEPSESKAQAMYSEAMQTLIDEAAIIPLFARFNGDAWSTRVKNFDYPPGVLRWLWPGGGLNYITLDPKS